MLFCLGTRGDVQPMLGVAAELVRRGHAPCVIATDDTRDMVSEHKGVAFESCGLDSLKNQEAVWMKAKTQTEFIVAMAGPYVSKYAAIGCALLRACRKHEAQVVVSGLYGLQMALDVCEAENLPMWAFKLMPDGSTAYRAPFGTGPSSKWGWVNLVRHWHRLFAAVLAARECEFTKHQNEFRKEVLGLGPVSLERLEAGGKYLPTVFLFSSALHPRPPDWPAWHKVAAPAFLPGRATDIPLSVKTFLESGKVNRTPIACVTFGSMSCLDDAHCEIVPRCVEACLAQGLAVVLLTGWSERAKKHPVIEDAISRPNGRLISLTGLPHDILFPDCSLIIHHGGAGTTSRAARCGVPQLVVPLLKWLDQSGWADALEERRAGIHVRDPNVEVSELEKHVRSLVTQYPSALEYRARARFLQREMRTLDGEAENEGCVRACDALLAEIDVGERGPNESTAGLSPKIKRMLARSSLKQRGLV